MCGGCSVDRIRYKVSSQFYPPPPSPLSSPHLYFPHPPSINISSLHPPSSPSSATPPSATSKFWHGSFLRAKECLNFVLHTVEQSESVFTGHCSVTIRVHLVPRDVQSVTQSSPSSSSSPGYRTRSGRRAGRSAQILLARHRPCK